MKSKTTKNVASGFIMMVVALFLAGCTPTGQESQNEPGGDSLSLSPASDEVYSCLKEKGWNPKVTWDGGIEAGSDSVPDAQRNQYQLDSDECWGKIDQRIADMTTEEIKDVYQKEVSTSSCLTELGYSVDAVPSEQQYVDTFMTNRWSAYGASDVNQMNLENDEWREINEECPQPAWSLGVS